ncbi:MAG: hypothetical protein OXE77_00830 [Flavobacteriaceae bacterium]|nr:hypothetical protein [Flavobacteriaceae bacterium]MCY4267911.1 hypothetical protein [Flavobacteriaceae bacterium]MCY4299212.1 hypothetical protein [Flavobacteriaceae bacterium]
MRNLNWILIICFATITVVSAQKKELRTANKMFEKGQLQELKAYLDENQSIFENADQRILDDLSVLQGKIARLDRNYSKALKIVQSLESKESYAEQVNTMKDSLVNDLITEAIQANENKNYAEAADKLYMSYSLRPDQYQDYLYFAASSAIAAKDTLAALDYYNQLKDMKYEGIQTKYFVTEKKSGEELEVSLSEYEIFQRSKDYENFRKEQTPSKYPEIVKNLGILYLQIGETDTALAVIQEARKQNPEDLELILTEGNIYIQLDEKEKFLELTELAAERDPNNALIFFNLGVVTSDLEEDEKAREYYEKSIAIDPTYMNAYLNLTNLILEEDQEIVDQMNNLGTSKADDAKYEELKAKREELYLETIPLLEKALTIENNCGVIRTLQNIYNVLDDSEKLNQYRDLYIQECSVESE